MKEIANISIMSMCLQVDNMFAIPEIRKPNAIKDRRKCLYTKQKTAPVNCNIEQSVASMEVNERERE